MGPVLVVKVAFGVLLAASIARAFFGAPPTRPHGGATAAAVAGTAGYAGALVEAVHGATLPACVLLGVAVEAVAVAVWMMRGRHDGPRGAADPEDQPPPADWSAFDRQRARWSGPSRARDRTPVA